MHSDDPPLFGTDLSKENEMLVDHFGFGADELEQASLNGLRSSFPPETEKARLEDDNLPTLRYCRSTFQPPDFYFKRRDHKTQGECDN